jgi:hypothetical protein
VKIWVEIVGLPPLSPNQHVFFVSIFSNLAIIVGKEIEKMGQIQKREYKAKKIAKNRDTKFEYFFALMNNLNK